MTSQSNKNEPTLQQASAPNVNSQYPSIGKPDLPTGEQLGINEAERNVQYSSMPQINVEPTPQQPQIIHHYIERPEPQPEVIVVERPVVIYEDPYPVLSVSIAWIILLINILFPGVGTMIVGCLGVKNPGYFICWGLFQVLTAFFILGWILAIQTSIALILKAE